MHSASNSDQDDQVNKMKQPGLQFIKCVSQKQ